MRFLIICSHLGFDFNGTIIGGGLQQFNRCLTRALASHPKIDNLGIWSQVDHHGTEQYIRRMVKVYAHNNLELDVRCFNGNRYKLSRAVLAANLLKTYDQLMYTLVNQAVLSLVPGHLPYIVWEIGREMFQRLPYLQYQVLRRSNYLLSISENTTQAAVKNNPGLKFGKVVHLCVEPPLYEAEQQRTNKQEDVYSIVDRMPSVLIVGSMYPGMLYKGHQQLIAGWPEVIETCPDAQLWIVGGGEGQHELESQVKSLPESVCQSIEFKGRLDYKNLERCYRTCRVFAMPSAGEGFGIVFIEAARYGVPSIGGKYDSVKEIVQDGVTGLLVEQNAHEIAIACIRLLKDDSLATRMGEAARQRYISNFRFINFRDRLFNALKI